MDTESSQQPDNGGDEGEDAHAPALPGKPPGLTDLGEAFAELEEWMAGEIDPELMERGGADLVDVTVANAILRRVGMMERRLALRLEVAEAEREKLDAFIAHQKAALGEAIERDRRWLQGWHNAQLGPHGRGPKTIELPAGTLKATAQQPEYEIEDEAAFMAWAEENAPSLIRQPPPKYPPPAPDKVALKKRIAPALKERDDWRPGDVVRFPDVPGVAVTMRGPKFEAKPDQG